MENIGIKSIQFLDGHSQFTVTQHLAGCKTFIWLRGQLLAGMSISVCYIGALVSVAKC